MTPCTDEEQAVLALLAAAWNTFIDLPALHPMERDEFCRGVHVLQNMVMARPVIDKVRRESK